MTNSSSNFVTLLGTLQCGGVKVLSGGTKNASPVTSAMAAGEATAADNLIFFDNFVAADEGKATEAATTEVVSAATLTGTAGPLARRSSGE